MSLADLTYPYEVIFFKPSLADRASTRSKVAAGAAIQSTHEDFVQYALEGVKVEDESVAVRVLEWTGYDGHMRFRASDLYPKFAAAREGASTEVLSLSHYHFFGPLPLTTPVPVYEFAELALKPAASSPEDFPFFLSAISEAFALVGSYKSALGFTIGWCKEDPARALVLIGWESVEAHMEDFRKSGERGWNPFIKKFGQACAGYCEVRSMYHVRTVRPGEAV